MALYFIWHCFSLDFDSDDNGGGGKKHFTDKDYEKVCYTTPIYFYFFHNQSSVVFLVELPRSRLSKAIWKGRFFSNRISNIFLIQYNLKEEKICGRANWINCRIKECKWTMISRNCGIIWMSNVDLTKIDSLHSNNKF